jgi:hypothetical protein
LKLIWATRGRTWGFRFLRDGGFDDPLRSYDAMFSNFAGDPEVCHRVGEKVALRFPDPDGRHDAFGRVISHDFVVFGTESAQINSIADGRRLIWPLVREEFERIWERDAPS